MKKNNVYRTLQLIHWSRTRRLIWIIFLLFFCLAGCSPIQNIRQTALNGYNRLVERVSEWPIFKIRKENRLYYHYSILAGTVTCALPIADAPVVIAAYTKNGNQYDIAHYTLLHEPGPFELAVPKGDYKIVGFVDKNGDLTYQTGEPIGQYREKPLCVGDSGRLHIDLNFSIALPNKKNIDFPSETAVVQERPEELIYTSPGATENLDDAIFDYENGVNGYWQPLVFFKTFGGNIFFLEDYDPAKIPVLFVHGATGSPRGWKYLISKLDHDHYQPWVFYYPSGSSIKSMGDLLYWKLFNLKLKYHFQKLHIVAHSMGGLVVRSFLVDYGQGFPEIKTLISISTPWSGDHMAQLGVAHSPVVIPAWRDMNPDSAFIQSIYRRPLPDGVEYYLFFSHRGSRNPLRSNNDGVVSLASQLDMRAQSEAKKIFGLDEDHDTILGSKQLAAQLQIILGNADAVTSKHIDDRHLSGMLKVHYSFNSKKIKKDIWPWLRLSPTSAVGQGSEDDIIIQVSALDNGRDLGPFPAGKYKATLYADAYRSKPGAIQVVIRSEKTAVMKVTLTPEGWIGDYICKKMYTDKNPPGIYRLQTNEQVSIRSIRLSGNGLERRLTPLNEKDFQSMAHNTKKKDWAYKNHFCFYNLPQGDYQLTIEADGYEPYTEMRQVIPGKSDNLFKGIALKPLEGP